MKLLIILLLLSFGVATKAQTYVREGNVYVSSTGELKSNSIKTTFKIKEKDGKEYDIYCSKKSGACYIIKLNKENKETKKYLPKEVAKEVSRSVGIEYKGKDKNGRNNT